MSVRFSRLPVFKLLSDSTQKHERAAEVWRKLHGLAFELAEGDVAEWNDRAANVLRAVESLLDGQSFRDARILLAPTFGNLLDTVALELRRLCAERWEVEGTEDERWAEKLETLRLQELREKAAALLPLCVDAIEACHFRALIQTAKETRSARGERVARALAEKVGEAVTEIMGALKGTQEAAEEAVERAGGAERAAIEARDAAKGSKREEARFYGIVELFRKLDPEASGRRITNWELEREIAAAKESKTIPQHMSPKTILNLRTLWIRHGGPNAPELAQFYKADKHKAKPKRGKK